MISLRNKCSKSFIFSRAKANLLNLPKAHEFLHAGGGPETGIQLGVALYQVRKELPMPLAVCATQTFLLVVEACTRLIGIVGQLSMLNVCEL